MDALVLDAVQWGFSLVAMHLGIPYVHVSNALHADYWGRTPIYIYDWPHEEGPAALARNQQGLQIYLRTRAAVTGMEREFAEQVGLQLDWDDPAPTISRRGWLTQTPKEFDFPSDHWPDYFHYVGPLHESDGRAPAAFPWGRLSGEPLIYASMGTIQNGAEDVFRKIVAGAQAPGRQIVVLVGPHLSTDQIGAVPANTVIVNRAPQIELLKRSAICITHSGLNTSLESLAQRVPMVAIPVTNDQPGVAARIAYTKTGIVIPFKELNAERVRDALDEVMRNPTYRENAQRLQASIQKTNGLDVAADLIERAFQRNGKAAN